jgi:hypothetical protein
MSFISLTFLPCPYIFLHKQQNPPLSHPATLNKSNSFLVLYKEPKELPSFFADHFSKQVTMGRSPCCDKVGLKKGPWTPEEDQKLLAYIEEHGHGSWRALPAKAGDLYMLAS